MRNRTSAVAAPRLRTGISEKACKTVETIREVAREKPDLSDEELDELLDARKMTEV